jgi:hypothetical protein
MVAIGADTDHTGETVTAWFGDIRWVDCAGAGPATPAFV